MPLKIFWPILLSVATSLATLLPLGEAQTIFAVPLAYTRYVAPAGVDELNCSEPTRPCRTLQYAHDLAEDGDTIALAGGTYTGLNALGGHAQMLAASKSISLRGGYSPDFFDRSPEVYPTILDAGQGGRILYADGVTGIVLDGLSLVNGSAVGLGGGEYGEDAGGMIYFSNGSLLLGDVDVSGGIAQQGGGLYCNASASVTVDVSNFSNNNAKDGGALYCLGDLLVSDSRLDGNLASRYGGGIYSEKGDLSVFNSLITGNHIQAYPYEGSGGGIFSQEANLAVQDSTISSNIVYSPNGWTCGGGVSLSGGSASLRQVDILDNSTEAADPMTMFCGGGGVYNGGGSLTLEWVLIHGNDALSPGLTGGGGLYNFNGTAEIRYSTISENRAGEGGGIAWSHNRLNITDTLINKNTSVVGGGLHISGTDSVVNLLRTTVQGNSASEIAGGILLYYEKLSLVDSLVAENTAGVRGGGIFQYDFTNLAITNSTLSGNIAGEEGGGIYTVGTAEVTHSTFAGNRASNASSIFFDGSFPARLRLKNSLLVGILGKEAFACTGNIISMGYNLTDAESVCYSLATGDLAGVDPAIGSLAANGGQTYTHALLTGSPAIDAGVCTDLEGQTVIADARGRPRPIGPACDIGAYEYIPGEGQFKIYLPRMAYYH
jgi:predicted outer membrane repeat protein